MQPPSTAEAQLRLVEQVLPLAWHRAGLTEPPPIIWNAWRAATGDLLTKLSLDQQAIALRELLRAWNWANTLTQWGAPASNSASTNPTGIPYPPHAALGPAAITSLMTTLVTEQGAPDLMAIAGLALRAEQLADLPDDAIRGSLVTETDAAVVALASVRDTLTDPVMEPSGGSAIGRLGPRVVHLVPALAALAVPIAVEQVVERDNPTPQALLDHAQRVMASKLAALESGDVHRFQPRGGLSLSVFRAEAARVAWLRELGLLPVVRAALLHLDFAKGGTPRQRRQWAERDGIDLSVHNMAAAAILRRHGHLRDFAALAAVPDLTELVITLVEHHGLCGQAARGETPLPLLAGWVWYFRHRLAELANVLGLPASQAAAAAADCLHVINLCDTAAVREGLMTNDLLAAISHVEACVARVVAEGSDPTCPSDARASTLESIELELADLDGDLWEPLPNPLESDTAPPTEGHTAELGADQGDQVFVGPHLDILRSRLADRLARLRQSRRLAGEPPAAVEALVATLPDAAVQRLCQHLRFAQLWYTEAATAGLSPAAQLKVLALGLEAAHLRPDINTNRPYNITFLPLVPKLGMGAGQRSSPVRAYRVRLVEALLAGVDVAAILAGHGPLALTAPGLGHWSDPAAVSPGGPATAVEALGCFATPLAGGTAVALDFDETPEAAALLTLLEIYQTKNSAAFHATLKALCDLYGLRKDDFDRLANEADYLGHMNAARCDKQRMLDHVRPGLIVEVGPGGGVVLDLLAERFATSEVIGLDASQAVVEALAARRQRASCRWQVIQADAFALADHLGGRRADTIVFCSVLHEIFSYVEHPRQPVGNQPPRRFSWASVAEMLTAAWRALAPQGRLVIRDGVMPPRGQQRQVRLLTAAARSYFELFATQFAARRVAYQTIAPDTVALDGADAMEFLYKLTWGSESFPYEIREQYGVLPYDEYREAMRACLTDAEAGFAPRFVDLPPHQAHYLQEGYRRGLAGQVELLDADGQPVELPDSNALWVIVKEPCVGTPSPN